MPELPRGKQPFWGMPEQTWFLPDIPLRAVLHELLGMGEPSHMARLFRSGPWETHDWTYNRETFNFSDRLWGHAEGESAREYANRISSDLAGSLLEDMPLLLRWEADELDRILAESIEKDPDSEISRTHAELIKKFDEFIQFIEEASKSMSSLMHYIYDFDSKIKNAGIDAMPWTDRWNRTLRNIGYIELVIDIYRTVQDISGRGDDPDGKIKEAFSQWVENFDHPHEREMFRNMLAEVIEDEYRIRYYHRYSFGLMRAMDQAAFFVGSSWHQANAAKNDESGEQHQSPKDDQA